MKEKDCFQSLQVVANQGKGRKSCDSYRQRQRSDFSLLRMHYKLVFILSLHHDLTFKAKNPNKKKGKQHVFNGSFKSH